MGCICGQKFPGAECAHYLSAFMIRKGWLEPLPKTSTLEMCTEGRYINAKELRDHVFRVKYSYVGSEQPSDNNNNYFIFCYKGSSPESASKRHVYYGTKTVCNGGNNNGGSDWDHYEFYK